MENICVIGAGSWGTALSVTLSNKGHNVRLWDIDKDHLKALKEDRENVRYLKDVPFNNNLTLVEELKEGLDNTSLVVFSAPAQHFRQALKNSLPLLKDQMLLNVAKGIETESLKLLSQVAEEIAPSYKFAVLSGPSHAEEVGQFLPTTVAVSSRDKKVAEEIQDIFMTDMFRVYTNSDILGVELGGALKNIIALGAGISDGMGYGDNAKAAIMTRGIAEIARLGEKMGAKKDTFLGLSGIGDLIVTCTSEHSRNRRCGLMIGKGMNPEEATKKVGMVVEGMYTTKAAYELSKELKVDMPITKAIHGVVYEGIDVNETAKRLMQRDKKHE